MRTLRRIAAAGLTGVLASVLLASPALAVKFPAGPASWGYTINLTTDSGTPLGGVWTTRRSDGRWDVHVCDWYSDGWIVTGRVDPGNGVVATYNSQGVGEANCTVATTSVRKFRLAWRDLASDWAPPQ
ncbi:hypothetical protein SAMN05421748_103393 [Paractinoplanes atraurantiacus]|uniref:Secreted protein n=2 Tax=Paractinoplanes atraurantiacus TaxID=1036182 RepID=A0A285H726_9ACTN|nr:hypothetical protein SAMN05421748_103393 [Actinoplanes atraurantiacus]